MAEVKTIKGVDDDAWIEFKSLAAKNNQTMGSFFGKLIGSYKEDSRAVWDDILNTEPILTEKEARNMMKTVTAMRKERGFRD